MLKIAHVGDSHAADYLANASALAKTLDADLCVHSGDICSAYYEQGIGNFSNKIFAPVIGNHDALLKAGAIETGNDWSLQPTQEALYSRYMAGCPFVDVVNGCTWWSKAINGVLVLGLNDAIYSASTVATETSWLQSRLSYADANNLPVLVFHHGMAKDATAIACNFTAKARISNFNSEKTEWHSWYPNVQPLYDTLKAFSGKLLCLIGGHGHYDMFATMTLDNGEKVPHISIGSTIYDAYNDVARSTASGEVASVVLNLYHYDKNLNTLQLYRLGADGCSDGTRRKMLVWDYSQQRIVSQCSATEY